MNIPTINPTEKENLAWAAGFLDGEACFKFYQAKRGRGRLAITVAQVRKEPLDRLANILGGKVRGPYGPYTTSNDGATRQGHYQWDTSTNELAELVIEKIMPWLCEPKKEQASEAVENFKNRRAAKTPFHPLKEKCLRNHDLTDPKNIYSPPKGGRQCKECNKLRKASKKAGIK